MKLITVRIVNGYGKRRALTYVDMGGGRYNELHDRPVIHRHINIGGARLISMFSSNFLHSEF